METQQTEKKQTIHADDSNGVPFNTIYDFLVGVEFGDPADADSAAFLPAFTGLVERIKEDGVEDCFTFEKNGDRRRVYTSITEGNYFVVLTMDRNCPRTGFYTATLEVNKTSLTVGQNPTRRPSKVLPYLMNIFGLIAKERAREE